MIELICKQCGSALRVSDENAGKQGRCPTCGHISRIPAPESAPAEGQESWTVQAAPDQWYPGKGEDADVAEIPLAADPMTKDDRPSPASRPPHIPAVSAGLVLTSFQGVCQVKFDVPTVIDALLIQTIASDLYALVDEQAQRRLVLDFSKVKLLSSQMLGVLINLQKKSAAIKGRLVLCGVRPELMKVFTIMKLEKVLTIVEDEGQAFAALGR